MFNRFESEEELTDYINRPKDDYLYLEKTKFDFESCTFEFEVKFSDFIKEFDSDAIFKNASFRKPVSFDGITFKHLANFDSCSFSEKVSFKDVIFEKEVSFGYFFSSVNFKKTKFQSTAIFSSGFSYNVDFSHCEFSEHLDLSERSFSEELYINDSIFHKNVNFQGSAFGKKVNAWNTTFYGDLNCRWANFRDKVNLTESSINKGFSNFYGANFEDNAYFYKTKFKKLDLKNSVIEKGVYFLDSKINKANRETNRIIKNQFIRQNNRIEALKFHHKEMSAYYIELMSETFQNLIKFRLWKFLKNIGDLFILVLNFLSNGFGLWWFIGIVFLFTTTSIIYYYYLINVNAKFHISMTNLEYWKNYVQFIVPTHRFDFIDNVTLNDKSYIIDYLGRIVSAFGIYQIVQAFRKFGKI